MISSWWILGIVSILIGLVLGKNRYAPAAIVLIALGVIIMLIKKQFNLIESPRLTLPTITGFRPVEVWQTFLQAGFAQIPLTATNAVIATSALIKSYWPERPVSESRLSLNMGVMNLILPFFGGMPLCHGAGGLAGQYYFGARTGGTNIIEGLIEIAMGLFLAGSIAGLFSVFPVAIIGAMMFLVGVELVKFAKGIHWDKDIIPFGITLIVSFFTNMAYGFLSGFVAYCLIRIALKKRASRMVVNPIGVIHTPFTNLEGMPIQPTGATGVKITVEVFEKYCPGLKDLEGFSHIILMYYFHGSSGFNLSVIPFLDLQPRPFRHPRAQKAKSYLGLSVVQLDKIENGVLYVQERGYS